jgi:hypothetical protein
MDHRLRVPQLLDELLAEIKSRKKNLPDNCEFGCVLDSLAEEVKRVRAELSEQSSRLNLSEALRSFTYLFDLVRQLFDTLSYQISCFRAALDKFVDLCILEKILNSFELTWA